MKPSDDPATQRSHRRENEAAETLAKEGYKVEQNPTPPAGSNKRPDYRIEGEYADCYSPDGKTSPRNIWSTVQGKVESGQADRIVLNLDDWQGDIEALRRQFRDWPIQGLKEIIVVRNGQVFRIP